MITAQLRLCPKGEMTSDHVVRFADLPRIGELIQQDVRSDAPENFKVVTVAWARGSELMDGAAPTTDPIPAMYPLVIAHTLDRRSAQ